MEKQKNIPQLRFPEFDGDWEKKKLGELSIINPTTDKLPDKFIYIDLESVTNGELTKEVVVFKNEAPSRAQRVLERDDILFQMVRPYQKNNLYFDKNGDYVASTGYAQIKTKQSPRFIYQYIHLQKFVNEVIERCTGTSYPAINSKDLAKISIRFPSLPEQQKIASFFTDIDQKISQLKRKKTLLEQYKKGVMQKIFSQEIRFKDDNGQEFPKWEKKRLDAIVSNFIVPMRDKPKELNGEIPWCRIEDFNGKYLTTSKTNQGVSREVVKKMNLKIYPINTLLVSCSANLGFCAIVKKELVTNQTFIGLVPDEKGLNVEYLYYVMILSAKKLNTLSSGTTISYLSREQFEKFTIQIPSFSEQTKIANFLSAIDDKINHIQKQIEKAEVWKKGLMQQMFV